MSDYRSRSLGRGMAPSRRSLLAGGTALGLGLLTRPALAQSVTPEDFRALKKTREVDGLKMAYAELGEGDPVVFLHGNPTSSFLWRDVIKHVWPYGRCIAPDLIGMGDSEKLRRSGRRSYTYQDHRDYLFQLLDQLDLGDNVTLVVHDWGSALGFDWAMRNERRVRGLCYMEAIILPQGRFAGPQTMSPMFDRLRSGEGEEMVLDNNFFVEQVLFGDAGEYLTEAEKDEYRRPYLEPGESRRPTLTWPREVPINGEPEDTHEIVTEYSQWLAQTDLPKLFVHAVPGAIFRNENVLAYARSFSNQTEVEVPGGHFVQERSGDAIGRQLAEWLREI